MGTLRLVALVSGSGRNLQSIIDAIDRGELEAEIAGVISSRRQAYAVERAKNHGLPVEVVHRKGFASVGEFLAALDEAINRFAPDLIVLCGFLSFLSEATVARYRHRIMNIHPSLLPAFGGKNYYGANVHEKVLEYGAKVTGCTVMFVDEGEDTGPIILQSAVPVLEDDTVESLQDRVLQEEYKLYPEAIRLFAAGRLRVEGRRVRLLPQEVPE